jgi:hypothetical protein
MLAHSQTKSVIGAIAQHPELFSLKPEALRKAVIDVVAAQIKHKSCKLEMLRQVVKALGLDQFSAFADELKPATIVALVKKYDKQRLEEAEANPSWGRMHFLALAKGSAEPTPAPPKPKKAAPKAPKPKKEPVRLLHESKSMGRRDED